jgi:Tol biopolymer transport system component/C-terminal processing protease CtpA/Prc
MRFVAVLTAFLCSLSVLAQTQPSWLRYPAISPDGSSIVFTYKGDLYRIPTTGGTAIPLTLHEAHDYNTIWSPDGKLIAFASDRHGNFDVYVMPAQGGEAKRLTYHSAGEVPFAFTPDGKNILFGAARLDGASNRQFPTGSMPELYSVPVTGGKVEQVLTTPAEDVSFSPDGSLMYYHDKKGGENVWRKHHTSAITRDIWVYDIKASTHKKLTQFEGEDRSPKVVEGGNTIYYLSEATGSFNVYKMNKDGSNPTPVTNFKTHPVRFLTASGNGTLAFAYNGDLYTHANGQSKKIAVNISADAKSTATKNIPVTGNISGMKLSPNGKEVAFIYRGDVFVTNVNGSTTKQVTNTPATEKEVSWHKDGRMLVYASQRNGKWGIYKAEIGRKEEPYFFASTLIKETPLVNGEKSVLNPKLSPDGALLAYVEGFNTLKLLALADGKTTTLINQKEWLSWGDGGHEVSWAPDSKWLLLSYAEQGIGNSEIGLLSVDGKTKLTNISQNGFGDGNPNWMMDGKMILWFSDRDGLTGKANSSGGQSDAYGLFLTQEAFNEFNLNKEDAALAKEIKEKADKADTTKKANGKTEPVKIDWEGLELRKARLTIHSSSLSDALVDKTGENLYYLARFERGFNLWTTNLRTKETKILAPLNANRATDMQWDKDGKKIFLQTDNGISHIEAASGKVERISIAGDMQLNSEEERRVMFDHVVRRTQDIFYKNDFHGIAWQQIAKDYQKFLPHVGNGYEFSELLSELLGELNVSHCGSSFNPQPVNPDATASLGIFFNYGYAGNGISIDEVVANGPLDKAGFNIKPGTVITAIDGIAISQEMDWAQLLNRKAGKNTLLTLEESGKSRELVVKPISIGEENQLLYKRWVKRNADEIDKLSNGQLGYIHIPGMNDGAYRTALEEAMGKYAGRKALVVDTRNNGGGDLVADLAMWLSGKRFMEYSNDRETANYEPTFRWNKPTISLANEANYSDGHCYAFAYQYLKIGKMVGMPVPGTCSFAAWELLQDGQTRWGTVPMGVKMMDGSGRYLENYQSEPDIKQMNEYGNVNKGKDQQLEAAVAELMKQVK